MRGGRERKSTFFLRFTFPPPREIRQHCQTILGKTLSVTARGGGPTSLDKHILILHLHQLLTHPLKTLPQILFLKRITVTPWPFTLELPGTDSLKSPGVK